MVAFALFDDGRAGWLSKRRGDLAMAMTMPVEIDNPRDLKTRKPGEAMIFFKMNAIPPDVRNISLKHAAVQGELPFVLKEDTGKYRVSDWRCENLHHARLQQRTPEASSTTVKPGFEAKTARHEDEIKESAGRLKARITSENCPNFAASSIHCKRPDLSSELSKLRQ